MESRALACKDTECAKVLKKKRKALEEKLLAE
jgi:hypothetical protein